MRGILLDANIGLVDGLNKLLLQCCTHFFVFKEISVCFIMETVRFIHLGTTGYNRGTLILMVVGKDQLQIVRGILSVLVPCR